MSLLVEGTLLTLTPLSGQDTPVLAPYSARGLTQTWEFIKPGGPNVWARRDVNGIMRSLADTRFRKYRTTITCRDNIAPCLDNAWEGVTCEVGCAFEFSYPPGGIPARPSVSGSQRVDSGITYYRPLLVCMVMDIKNSFAEWQAYNGWEIELEEI